MEKIGPVGVRSLIAALGSVTAIFSAEITELEQARGIGTVLAGKIVEQRDRIDVAGEIRRAADADARIVTPVDDEYPQVLNELHDPPLALYLRGSLQSSDFQGIAIVGTRHPTHYGMSCTSRLSFGLAKAGVTVNSGLALGVDTVAHDSALKAGGRSVAVVGSGLNYLYPPDNQALADRIAEQGCVLSEFPMNQKPDKRTFPMRNRIVSGLSRGVLVVEAGLKSGAMITANQAMDQGRTVFAVPGRIDSYASVGTNALLKDGACLVTEVRDVLEHYEMLFPVSSAAPGAKRDTSPELSDAERQVVLLLQGNELGVDALIRESGVAPSAMASMLIGLEMKKVVKMLPGRRVALATDC